MLRSVPFLNQFLVIFTPSKYIGINFDLQLNRTCRNEKENLLRFFFPPLYEDSPCSVFEATKIAITHMIQKLSKQVLKFS